MAPVMPRGLRYCPDHHAELLEVAVVEGHLRPGRAAEYRHRDRLVVLSPGLSVDARRSRLAHELVHAIHGDSAIPDPVAHRSMEGRAYREAAQQLVDPLEYAAAMLLAEDAAAGGLARRIAVSRQLQVIPRVVSVWEAVARGVSCDLALYRIATAPA